MIGYPSDRLFEEVAYIAYHLHWSQDEILRLEHRDRLRWVAEVATINHRINEATSERVNR